MVIPFYSGRNSFKELRRPTRGHTASSPSSISHKRSSLQLRSPLAALSLSIQPKRKDRESTCWQEAPQQLYSVTLNCDILTRVYS